MHPAEKERNQNLKIDLFFHPAALLGFKTQINSEILLI